jgi:hypothetical protein
MIIAKISGGLGNQLFQYAHGRKEALKQDARLILIPAHADKDTPRDFLLDNFNIKANIKKNAWYRYNPFVKTISGNWQSETYFKDAEKEIRSDLTLKKPLSEKAEEFKKLITASNSVSIHVRRGDYAENDRTKMKHGLCSPEYYSKAIAYVNEKISSPKFFVFSDDIAWVKSNLNLPSSTVFVSGNNISECEELVLMSTCKHNIIANSTFSWWGAWLNTSPEKIIVAPKIWFASGIPENDLIPENWIRI